MLRSGTAAGKPNEDSLSGERSSARWNYSGLECADGFPRARSVVVGIWPRRLLVVIGALVRVAILGPASERLSYLTFWPVVMVAALIGGVPAGATAVILSALLVHAVFVPLRDLADWLGLGVYLVGGGFIVGVTELFLRSRLHALAASRRKRSSRTLRQLLNPLPTRSSAKLERDDTELERSGKPLVRLRAAEIIGSRSPS